LILCAWLLLGFGIVIYCCSRLLFYLLNG
jgi:hypothetical protein